MHTDAFRRFVGFYIAFVAGGIIMMLELLASRMLAPNFGYSIYQWGALIGVVLSSLAFGYWIGSRVGDTSRAQIYLRVSLLVALLWIAATPAINLVSQDFTRSLGLAWGAVVASVLLVGPVSMLLAAISPIIASLTGRGGIANITGTIYTFSTIGSIFGTFGTAFYVIPNVGTHNGYLVADVILLTAAIPTFARNLLWTLPIIFAGCALAALGFNPKKPPGAVLQIESAYNEITLVESDKRRFLYLNYDRGPQTEWVIGSNLSDTYHDLFTVGPRISGGDSVLFLGVAGGAALKETALLWPQVTILGVDLDPAVLDVARSYFGLRDEKRVSLVVADARTFLHTHDDLFDVIAVDVYITGHIPFYCATAEFFAEVRNRLSDRGVLLMNVLALESGDELVGPLVKTVESAFPRVFISGRQSTFVIASKQQDMTIEKLRSRLQTTDNPELRKVSQRILTDLRTQDVSRWPIFTDDRSDIDFRSFRMLATAH